MGPAGKKIRLDSNGRKSTKVVVKELTRNLHIFAPMGRYEFLRQEDRHMSVCHRFLYLFWGERKETSACILVYSPHPLATGGK